MVYREANIIRTFENKDICIITHLVMVPNGALSDLEHQDTLIIKMLKIGPEVSIIHRIHSIGLLVLLTDYREL